MPDQPSYLEWLWQHLRARSLRFWADIDYRRWPSPLNRARLERAEQHWTRVELTKPARLVGRTWE